MNTIALPSPLSSHREYGSPRSRGRPRVWGKLLHVFGFLLCLALAAPLAHAVQPDEIMSNPAQELRARNLSRELRCMVCQNQSIDDSEAPLARDIRLLVRERVAAGDSDQQVLDFLVARYGEFVLLRPRFEPSTLPLWLLTPLLLIGGGIALWGYNRRRLKATPDATDVPPRLSEDEEARLAKLVAAKSAADGPL
ncbi:MAG: cytochrome c-type biogenesis protein CcmH [Proteobacteria bacterium]|nr:cytochrome c-type biogenesis protein CcmH [Pseudomonadota bacterium]